MKKLILVFFIIGTVMVFFGCQNESVLAPEIGQSNQIITTMAKKPAPSLSCKIDYILYLGDPKFDAEGRVLVWDGNIHGNIEGKILWYFVIPGAGPPNMPPTAHISFYEGRWEIWDGDDLLLAGNSAGSTAMPKEKDGIWRGNGIVTEAGAGFEDWIGRQTKEGGNVNWDFPYSGEGIFRIN